MAHARLHAVHGLRGLDPALDGDGLDQLRDRRLLVLGFKTRDLDFGSGWVKLGAATVNGNSTVELGNVNLPQPPKHVSIAAYKDVLATSVENGKK